MREAESRSAADEMARNPVTGSAAPVDVANGDEDGRARAARECQLLKLSAVGQLSSGVVHNFNNLLMTILGYTELLAAERQPPSAAERVAFDQIRTAVNSGAALARRLMTFAAPRRTSAERLDVNDAIDPMIDLLRDLLRRGIVLTWTPSPSPIFTCIPLNELEQAVVHLVLHAQDAMPEGGRIAITVSGVAALPVEAMTGGPASPTDGWVRIDVADHGVGRSSERCRRAFEPFYSTAQPGRAGLGLSVVHGLITQNGGAVSVTSREGTGSCFSLFLARYPPPLARVTAGTVIIVDDDPAVAQLVARYLGRQGHGTRVVPPADAMCLSVEQSAAIDVLVVSVTLANLSGPQLFARLRERNPVMGAVFLAACADALPAIDRPRDTTLVMKPFDPNTLCDAVADAVRSARGRRSGTA
jgi:two-component system, cell cycle sensor histidine kinase and response regulator CckA